MLYCGMRNGFFALISRMRYIQRWGLMRNSDQEDLQQHSFLAAVIAHALALIRNTVFNGDIDANAVAAYALYHDVSEIITGDLPTPIKHNNLELLTAYRRVEERSIEKLISMLPNFLRPEYSLLVYNENDDIRALVKAADKLAAYIKCVEERVAGNLEFRSAEAQVYATLIELEIPEVSYFLEHFMPAFGMTLDELTSEADHS